MFTFILLILISLICGLQLTYKLKLKLFFTERILFGFVIALAFFTQLIYLITYFSGGLKLPQNIGSMVIVSLFGIYSAFSLFKIRDKVKDDFKNALNKLKNKSELYLPLTMIFWFVIFCVLFSKNVFMQSDGIYSSTSTDIPVHYSFITSFVWGENFPHQTPLYAGEKLVYPILSDYLSAFFISMGMNAIQALNYMGIVMCSVLTGLMYFFTLKITDSKKVSTLSIFLLYLGGGWGFWKFFERDLPDKGYNFIQAFYQSPDLYTDLFDYNFQFFNFIIAYLLPQRSFLFGFPMALIILSLLWQAIKDGQKLKKQTDQVEEESLVENNIKNQMLIAGFTAGILPLFHYHSFMSVSIISGFWFLLFFQKSKEYIKDWFYFFIPMTVLAIPQLLMATGTLKKNTETFKPHIGWMATNNNYVWFWFKNTGFTFILILEALLSKSTDKNIKKMYIPFFALFLAANLISFSPCWIGDNAKILFFWFIGSMPLLALALRNLYNTNKTVAITILLTLTLSGFLDVSRYTFTNIRVFRVWSADAVNIAKDIINKTDPKSIFLSAPVHYSPIYLTGRKVLTGEHVHVCTQGIDPFLRELDIKEVFQSNDELVKLKLISKLNPDYIIVGPPELSLMNNNKTFFDRYFKVFLKTGEETVYQVKKN